MLRLVHCIAAKVLFDVLQDMVSNAHAYQQRQALLAALQQARREQAVKDTIIEELDSPASPDHGGDPSLSAGSSRHAAGCPPHSVPTRLRGHHAETAPDFFSNSHSQPDSMNFAYQSAPFETGRASLAGKRSLASVLGEAEGPPSTPPRKQFKAFESDDSPSDMQTG